MTDILKRESNKITIASFYENYQLGKYNLDPVYQRKSIWSDEKKSFLMDSIFRNFPMPPIFLHQRIDNATGKTSYDVIDGKQRLTTIVEFIDGKIPVTDETADADIVDPIAGKYFSDLQAPDFGEFLGQLWRYSIPIEYIDTDDASRIDAIFDRLNRNGEPLKGQELRNANYHGKPLLQLVADLVHIPFWKERFKSFDVRRMEDMEFISELVFLLLKGEVQHANQAVLDDMYQEFAEDKRIVDDSVRNSFHEVTQFMESLELDYSEFRIGGVSHLYGVFSLAHVCVEQNISAEIVRPQIQLFYSRWIERRYDEVNIAEYKQSMSSRTKDKGQRQKRLDSLLSFCSLTR